MQQLSVNFKEKKGNESNQQNHQFALWGQSLDAIDSKIDWQ